MEPLFLPVTVSDFASDLEGDLHHLSCYKLLPKDNRKLPQQEANKSVEVVVKIVKNLDKFKHVIQNCAPDLEYSDEFSYVILCKATARRFKIFHGSLLKLSSINDCNLCINGVTTTLNNASISTQGQDNRTLNYGKVAVAVIGDYFEDSSGLNEPTVHMLPNLWFNVCRRNDLHHALHCHCLVTKVMNPDELGTSASLSTIVNQVPFADEVVITCINSPQYSSSGNFDHLLKVHFTKTRLLEDGDVFGLYTKDDPCYTGTLSDGSDVRFPVVYFSVKKISSKCPSGFLVDSRHTELLQESSVHDYIPAAMLERYNCGVDSACLLKAMKKYASLLLDIIRPFLTNRWTGSGLYPVILLGGLPGSGKSALSQSTAVHFNMHHYTVNCNYLVADTASATEAKIKQMIGAVAAYAPCVLLLEDVEAIGKDRDGCEDSRVAAAFKQSIKKLIEETSDWPIIVIATTTSMNKLTLDIQELFLQTLDIEAPDENMRLAILQLLLSKDHVSPSVSLKQLAQKTAGMVYEDFTVLLSYARQFAYHRQNSQVMSGDDQSSVDFKVDTEDLMKALIQMQSMQSDAIGAPKKLHLKQVNDAISTTEISFCSHCSEISQVEKPSMKTATELQLQIPNVTWNDVGGLGDIKRDILDTIQLPLEHPELLQLGLRRSGILLYGPPGTGKTLLAKAVATECSLNFLSVKGPELLNMYVGQSEENVRAVFQRARNAIPCIIFFDELDSLAPNRGRSGDSGGVMDRVVSQLLAELDGLNKSANVFVIGATNRPDLIDPALLRPGRFDKMVYLGVSENHDSQLKILKALTRKFKLGSSCSLERFVEKCPFNMTGADFYALCADASLSAMKKRIDQMQSDQEPEVTEEVLVEEEDFEMALANLVPSLSVDELNRYKNLERHLQEKNKGNR